MNQSFSVIYNPVRGALTVVSEITRRSCRGHQSRPRLVSSLVSAAALAALASMSASALAGTVYVSGKGDPSKTVSASDTTTSDKYRAVGGWGSWTEDDGAALTAVKTAITVTGGSWNLVSGGHYAGGGNDIAPKIADTSVTVTGGKIHQLFGGSGGSDNTLIKQNNSGVTRVIISGGEFGETQATTNVPEQQVVGGDLLKHGGSYKEGIDNIAESHLSKTSVVISGGTFNASVIGGSAAIVYYGYATNGVQTSVDSANVTISGGTFNQAVVAGGLASGHSTRSVVTSANLTITNENSPVFNEFIYAGGLTSNPAYGAQVSVGHTTATIENASVKGFRGTGALLTIDWDKTKLNSYASDNVYVATDLTLNNATVTDEVTLGTDAQGTDSTLTIAGTSTVNTLNLSTAAPTITGKAGSNGSSAVLNLTDANVTGNSLTLAGDLTVSGGLSKVTKLTVGGSGKVAVKDTSFAGNISITSGTYDYSNSTLAGSATLTLSGGSLSAASAELFTTGLGTHGAATDAGKIAVSNLTLTSGSVILTDATYNLDYVSSVSKLIAGSVKLVLTGSLKVDSDPGKAETTTVPIAAVDSVSGQVEMTTVTVSSTDKNLVIGTAETASEDTTEHNSNLSVAAVDLGTATSVEVNSSKTLTLTGNGGELISSKATGEAGETKAVSVALTAGATLQLGSTEVSSSGGTLTATVSVSDSTSSLTVVGDGNYQVAKIENSGTVSLSSSGETTVTAISGDGTVSVTGSGTTTVKEISGDGSVSVAGTGTLTVEKLSGETTVSIGNSEEAGTMTVNSLTGMTGTLFADPAWKLDGTDTEEQASQLAVTSVDSTGLTATLIAGQNSIVTVGATNAEGLAAVKAMLTNSGLSWGSTGVTAATYIASPVKVTTGRVITDGSLTTTNYQATVSSSYSGAGTVYAASGSLLVVNQATATTGAYIDGNLTISDGACLGIYNASESSFTLASGTIAGSFAKVVTDNPFFTATVDSSGTVTTSTSEVGGISAIESLGVQSLALRAGSVLTEAVADRTALGNPLSDGLNLWVSVQGERYEADGYRNGGSFTADIGYGTFGGAVALTDNLTAGGALQYAKGSSRGGVSSVKNEVDSWGLAFFGTYRLSDAIKLVADLSLVHSGNDISSSQSALNQKLDADLYAVGIAAQTSWQAGRFVFTPSIGLRYNRLETDAMTIGSVGIDKQTQNLLQVPLSLRIGASSENANGWSLSPAFKLSFVPTLGDKDIKVLGSDVDVIDTAPVQGTFGLSAGKGNLSVNADLMMGGGKRGTSSVGGKVGMQYCF